MMLWIFFALLTLILVLLLLGPILRPSTTPDIPETPDLDVYRDQLAELTREQELGRIGPKEAEAARAEISRRILAVAIEKTPEQVKKPMSIKGIVIATLILTPLSAIAIYAYEGRPDLPGLPQAERLANAENNNDFDALVYKVQLHLQRHPEDQKGWQVLIRALTDLQRYDQAAQAWRSYIKVAPATADNLASFGEALVLANNGLVNPEAENIFAEARKIDPNHPMSRFFAGLALRQRGEVDQAIEIWQGLLADAPADAPWRQAVANSIENAKSAPNMPANNAMMNAQGVDANMIRGMVDGLAARLAEDGNDLEGWLRLARSRQVLGEMDKARAALDQAEMNFKDDQAAMARIAEARTQLEKAQ